MDYAKLKFLLPILAFILLIPFSSASINYMKEGWVLENKSDIGSYVDVSYEKSGNDWIFHIAPNQKIKEFIKSNLDVLENPEYKKDKLKKYLPKIKDYKNLKKIDKYPITLQKQICSWDTGLEECHWKNITSFHLNKNKVNLLLGETFKISNLDIGGEKYRIKMGFHSISYASTTSREYYTMYVDGDDNKGYSWDTAYTMEDLYQYSKDNPLPNFVQPFDYDNWTETISGTDAYNTAPDVSYTWNCTQNCSTQPATDTSLKMYGSGSIKVTRNGTGNVTLIWDPDWGTGRSIYVEALSIYSTRYLNFSVYPTGNEKIVSVKVYTIRSQYDKAYTLWGRAVYEPDLTLTPNTWNNISLDILNDCVRYERTDDYVANGGTWTDESNADRQYYNHQKVSRIEITFSDGSDSDTINLDKLFFWKKMQIEKINEQSYYVPFRITFGNTNTTYFWEKNTHIIIGYDQEWYLNSNTHFKLGDYDSSIDEASDGCSINFETLSSHEYYLRGADIKFGGYYYVYDTKFYPSTKGASTVPGYFNLNLYGLGGDMRYVTVTHGTERASINVNIDNVTLKHIRSFDSFEANLMVNSAPVSLDDITLGSGSTPLEFHHFTPTARNIVMLKKGNNIRLFYHPLVVTLIDYTFQSGYDFSNSVWTGGNYNVPVCAWVEIYGKQSLSLKVKDSSGNAISGATVNITDVFGNQIDGSPFTTNSTGQIYTEILYQFKHVKSNGGVESLLTMDGDGTTTIHVADNSGFAVGDNVAIVITNASQYLPNTVQTSITALGTDANGDYITLADAVSSYYTVSAQAMIRKKDCGDELITYTPHLLTITKPGYVPIKLNLTMDSKKNLELEMHGKRNLYPINLAMVSGTEYKAGDTIDVEVQATDAYNNPISGATCTFDIYYPDKTLWKNDISTTYLADGIYYNNSFTVPSILGVYTYIANCTYSGTSQQVSKTFNVIDSYATETNASDIINYVDSVESNQAVLSSQIDEVNTTTHQILTNQTTLYDKIASVASEVWAYSTRTLTGWNFADIVWTYATRTLTNPDDYKADVSSLATQQNITDLQTHGDSYWTTATGFATPSDVDAQCISELELNQSHGEGYYNTTGTSPSEIWNYATRNLTYYPPTYAVLTLDISRHGLINTTYYDVASSHILDSTEPYNSEAFKTYYYKKYGIDIGYVPSNVTNGYVIYWLKKVGNPTGNLNITVDGSLIKTIDVSTLSTDYTKFITQFDKSNITDSYVEIKFIGQSTWTQANDVLLGSGSRAAVYSMESSDDSTWEHPDYEYAVGLIVEYNQKSIADQMNEESVYIQKKSPEAICPGQTIWATFEFYDYQGNELDIQDLPTCSLQKINDDGTITNLGSANIDVTETERHRIRVVKNGTYTGTLENNGLYKIKCISINITTQGGNIVTIENQGVHFRTLTESECLDPSILATQTNITELQIHGDANWLTATGFLTDAQLNASHGTGLYNSTVNETSVAQHVWEYNVTDISGNGIAGYVLRTILEIVQWIERLI